MAKYTGAKFAEQPIKNFFAPLHANGFVYNSTVTYDELLGRFIVAVTDSYGPNVNPLAGGPNASYLDIAVSKTADPTAGWTFDKLDIAQGTLADGGTPKIGWNADTVVVSLYMADTQPFNKVIAFNWRAVSLYFHVDGSVFVRVDDKMGDCASGQRVGRRKLQKLYVRGTAVEADGIAIIRLKEALPELKVISK